MSFNELFARGVGAALKEVDDLELVDLPLHPDLGWPHVVVLDGDRCKPASARSLRTMAPQIGLVILAATAERSRVFGALGANTFCLPKDTSGREVTLAVLLAAETSVAARPSIQSSEGERYPQPKLTDRERQVFMLVALGGTHASIASELHIGVETVRTHTQNIRRKYDVQSNRDLVRLGAGGHAASMRRSH